MDFPARFIEPVGEQKILNEAFDILPCFVGEFSIPDGNLYLLEVQNEEFVKNINPNFELLIKSDATAVIITSISNSVEYDFVSRFFAPELNKRRSGYGFCTL